ncbi:type IV toxin-antitoxin system AbiEi family antitoxin [Segatella copri]|uniref:type IV toxin-antitoxin system AbiEi family antitoxin n=1 Tax=Segatella copri TaxID=165179 RepID=UPI002600FDA5|nr:type IV toxin-antitoxin system AbiEi family antitoxin [Segatella copri]WOG32954.1 type IV toxin-antitoxin system AbiEi family antitoxin [Segatella copri]
MANNNIINQALDALKASLPMDDVMSTTAIKEKCVNDNDTIVKIMNVDFVCLVKENITKTSLNPTLATMQAMNNDKQQILLVTQYVTPQVSTELASKGINYLDCAGNCLVRYMKRGNLIFQISNQGRKNTEPQVKTYPVFQDAGLKVVFYLLQNADNVKKPYREIKEQIGVSLGSVKNILDELARRGFVCDTRNGRAIKDKKKLLDLWVSNYNEVLKPKLLVGTMAFRTEAKRNEWKNIELPQGMVWGGEPAANLIDGYLQPGSFDIYTELPAAHLMRTGAVKQDVNGEIHLYNKFWNWETDNRTIPAILIYADLMGSGNCRCLEAAQRILKNELKDFE